MIHAVEVALLHAWFVEEDYELANVRPQSTSKTPSGA